ncbi:hypothetical protein PIB30_116711 [Stylosanthes scabra]|uniref:Reverse transcriptase zinc-binding domain-containing protein n=1 Tax=Stylosanthes scabra TaxID=79078 RepID=A0ABU6X9V0_9FABA|nr:hypothetical protein [Stylosanthes scabra]
MSNSLTTDSDTQDYGIQFWGLKCNPKIKVLLWKMSHNGLPTMERLHSRLPQIAATYPRCSLQVESTFHCFFSCSHSIGVWQKLGHHLVPMNLQSQQPWRWLDHALQQILSNSRSPQLITHFVFTLWSIWLARNLHVFEGKQLLVEEILSRAGNLAIEFSTASTLFLSSLSFSSS